MIPDRKMHLPNHPTLVLDRKMISLNRKIVVLDHKMRSVDHKIHDLDAVEDVKWVVQHTNFMV